MDQDGDLSIDAESPWPGLAAFHETEAGRFYGRDAEIDQLCRIVGRERVTVFFGHSGLGKTSLLCAGLFPRLRDSHILPVHVRLQFSRNGPPFRAQLVDALTATATRSGVEMPLVRAETLWEMFYRQDTAFWSEDNRLMTPLLVFDQFEEVFTLGRDCPAEMRAFLDELVSLAEGRPTAAVGKRLESSPEEYSQYAFSRQACKILLSLREDYLAELESVANGFRAAGNNRLRLRRMNGLSALQVVVRVGDDLIQQGIAEDIVRFLAAAPEGTSLQHLEIEPALLSVYCRELDAQRRQRGLSVITRDLVAQSSSDIFRDFYERSFAGVDPAIRTFVEEELVTSLGFRDAVPLETAVRRTGVTRAGLEALIVRRLLRIEQSGRIQRIELTHDRLSAEVLESRRRRREGVQHVVSRSIVERRIESLVLRNRILIVSVLVLLALLVMLALF